MRVLSRCIFVEPAHAPLVMYTSEFGTTRGEIKVLWVAGQPSRLVPASRASHVGSASALRQGRTQAGIPLCQCPLPPPPGRPVQSSPSRRSVQITPASSPACHIPFSLPSIHHTLSASASFRGHIVPSLLSRNRPSRQDLLSLQSIVPTAAYSHSFFGLPTRKRLVDRTNSLSVSQPT